MNNLTFTSPYTALLWERYSIFLGASHSVLCFTYLPIPVMWAIFGWSDPDDVFTADDMLSTISPILMIAHIFLCNLLISEKDTKKNDVFYPLERHYILPVNSYTLACTHALFNIATIILYWSTFYYINYYIFSESVVHASDWFMRVSHWSLGIICYLVMITTRLTFSTTSNKIAEAASSLLCYSCVFIGIFLTDSLSNSTIGFFALIVIIIISILNIKVSRKFTQNTETNFLIAISNHYYDSPQILQKDFVTQFQAQLWYEWREWGKYGLISSIGGCIFGYSFFSVFLSINFNSLSTELYNYSIYLSLWICFIVGLTAKKRKKTNNNFDFIFPMEADYRYYTRFVMSFIICLFCVTLPLIIFYILNSSNLKIIESFGLIVFTTNLGILILSNPVTSNILILIYFIILILFSFIPEQINSISLLIITFVVLMINIYLYKKCIHKNLTHFPLLSIILAGLLGSFFIFS